MSAVQEREPFEPKPLFVVNRTQERQYEITRSFDGPGTWEEKYVAFSGYFGAHGPHVFAAAPEMLEALKEAERHLSYGVPADCPPLTTVRAAIRKAEGQS